MRVFQLLLAILISCAVTGGCARQAVTKSPDDPLVFVHLSDIHCARRTENPPKKFLLDIHTKDFVHSFDIAARTVDRINAMTDVDFVVITGDLTDNGADAESLTRLKTILDGLNVPYYAGIGDHDRPDVFGKVFPGPFNAAFDIKGRRVVMLDANTGRLEPESLQWLLRELDAHEDVTTLVFLHRPLVMSSLEKALARRYYHVPLTLENATEVLDAMDRRPWVRAVFAGHCHMNTERTRNRCLHVTTGSLIEAGNFYRVVRVDRTGIRTELRHAETLSPAETRLDPFAPPVLGRPSL